MNTMRRASHFPNPFWQTQNRPSNIKCMVRNKHSLRPISISSQLSAQWAEPVEGLYCKRPIQCLASSEILIPHPLTARRVCTPPPLVRGEDTLAGWRGGGGSIVRKTPDTALYSIYVSTLQLNLNGVPSRDSYSELPYSKPAHHPTEPCGKY